METVMSFITDALAPLSAVFAAALAGFFAWRSRLAQTATERAIEREKRLATVKAETYKPIIELFQEILDGTKSNKQPNPRKMRSSMSDFATWAQIYGSDDVVRSFHRFMNASSGNPPPTVSMYYYGQLLLAIRRDLGDPDTAIGVGELVGIRMNEFYETDLSRLLVLDERTFLDSVDWSPPWR